MAPGAPSSPVTPDARFVIDASSLPAPRVPVRPIPPDLGLPGPGPGPQPIAPPRVMPQTSPVPDTGEVLVTGRVQQFDPSSLDPRLSGRPTQSSRRGLRLSLFCLLLLTLAGGGYIGYMELVPGEASEGASADSNGAIAAKLPASSTSGAQATTASTAPVDSGAARSPTSSRPSMSNRSPATPPAGRGDPNAPDLVITSQPEHAQVYLDGAPVGRSPVKLEAITDRLKLAIIEPGYKPYLTEIDGRGRVSVVLEEVTPPNGPAGIKIRCKQKNRYYVILDGEPTGQLCPTERLGVELGEHTAEIYDPVTDSRRVFKVNVDQTRLSVRVRAD